QTCALPISSGDRVHLPDPRIPDEPLGVPLMSSIAIDAVSKIFGKTPALKDIALDIRDGEFMVLLGPSGCGKTTLLRCVAGLEQVNSGRIRIGERYAPDLEPRDRHSAMVLQSYALFPHMTV